MLDDMMKFYGSFVDVINCIKSLQLKWQAKLIKYALIFATEMTTIGPENHQVVSERVFFNWPVSWTWSSLHIWTKHSRCFLTCCLFFGTEHLLGSALQDWKSLRHLPALRLLRQDWASHGPHLQFNKFCCGRNPKPFDIRAAPDPNPSLRSLFEFFASSPFNVVKMSSARRGTLGKVGFPCSIQVKSNEDTGVADKMEYKPLRLPILRVNP